MGPTETYTLVTHIENLKRERRSAGAKTDSKDADALYTLDRRPDYIPNGLTRLGCGVPMLRCYRESFDLAESDAQFNARLCKEAPWFAGLHTRENGLFLAGGAVSALLTRSDEQHAYFGDYDLFLVGHDKTSASEAIRGLAARLAAQFGKIEIYRAAGSITFICSQMTRDCSHQSEGKNPDFVKVQVILQLYENEAAVIHSFDLGSSAVGWNDRQIVMSEVGALAMFCGANLLDLEMRYPSYEHRIQRYFERGFDIIMLDLDVYGLANHPSHASASYHKCFKLPFIEIHQYRNGTCPRAVEASSVRVLGPVADSSYTPGAFIDNRVAAVTRNITEVNDSKRHARAIDPEKLCAFSIYTPHQDIFGGGVSFSDDALMKAVTTCLKDAATLPIGKLRQLLGVDLAIALADAAIRDTVPWATIATVVVKRIQQLPARIEVPLNIITVGGHNGASGRYPRTPLTAAQWFGRALKLPAAASGQ